ncbi:vWA domain-containing protein [Microbacterium aurum]
MTLDFQKLSAAKLWLISAPVAARDADAPRDLPYLAHALYALIPVESAEVHRITGDEWWRVYINPAWLDRSTVPEVGEELAHLTWHLLADHTGRARDQDVDRSTAAAWNRAADATVSHTLAPDALRPDHLATAADFGMRPGLAAEQYYARATGLPVPDGDAPGALEPKDGCGSAADGIHRRHEHGPDSDIGAVSAFDATEIRRRVAIEYRDHTLGRGTDPGDALRWVKETLEPRTPWEQLLAGAVRRAIGWTAGRGDYTYTRPSRRASSLPGIVLPGQHRPVPRPSIVVDTSGSVDDQLLARALGEVDSAIAALGIPGANVTVYSVDAAVHTVEKVRRARDAKLVGAGGTDLRIGLRAAEDERPRPDVVIVLTDGGTPWPATPPPGAAVIAAVLGRHRKALPSTPPWAVRVECILDR